LLLAFAISEHALVKNNEQLNRYYDIETINLMLFGFIIPYTVNLIIWASTLDNELSTIQVPFHVLIGIVCITTYFLKCTIKT